VSVRKREWAVHYSQRGVGTPSAVKIVAAPDRAAAFVSVADWLMRECGVTVLSTDGCGCYLTGDEVKLVRDAGIKECNGSHIIWKIEEYKVRVGQPDTKLKEVGRERK